MIGTVTPASLALVTNSKVFFTVIPLFKAVVLATWMTGPSAIGSENGTPNSMMSTPPAWKPCKIGTVSSMVGKPAVTKVTKALRSAWKKKMC